MPRIALVLIFVRRPQWPSLRLVKVRLVPVVIIAVRVRVTIDVRCLRAVWVPRSRVSVISALVLVVRVVV